MFRVKLKNDINKKNVHIYVPSKTHWPCCIW